MYELVAFDLDGTLADSKQPIPSEIAGMLLDLQHTGDTWKRIAIISGCGKEQMIKQCANRLYVHDSFFFLPTSGAQILGPTLKTLHELEIDFVDKVEIYKAWEIAAWNYIPRKPFGPIPEDRKAQITFSMCGQDAPLKVKEEWDPGAVKRTVIAVKMRDTLGDRYDVKLGGTTSIDVTYAGINKAYGMRKLMEHLKLEKEEVVFFGDKLQPGENDYPVKEMGIECIEVKNWQDTIEKCKKLFNIS